MASFYYFLSSLPYLQPGAEPPLTSSAFLEQCRTQVSAGQLAVLEGIGHEPRATGASAVERHWNAFETCLRNAVVRVRAHRLKQEAHAHMRPETDAFGHLENQVQEAFGRDPLSMEEQLDRLRWRLLDDLSVGHEFDFSALIIYRIKLLLLEKRVGLDGAAGRAQLDSCLAEKLKANQLPEFIHA